MGLLGGKFSIYTIFKLNLFQVIPIKRLEQEIINSEYKMKLTYKEHLINFGIGLLPELGVAYLLMKLFNEGWDIYWIIFFSIQAFYFIRWLLRTVISKLMFETVYKSKFINSYYEKLVQNRFPDPFEIYHEDIENYFEEIVCNESIKAETRISAASMLTSLRQWQDGGQIQVFLRMRKCAKLAVKKYMSHNFEHETELSKTGEYDKTGKKAGYILYPIVIVIMAIFFLFIISKQKFGWDFWEFLIGGLFLLGILNKIFKGINWLRKKIISHS